MAASSPTAVLHHRPGPNEQGDDGMAMLHLCFAVLGGLMVLVALVVLTLWWRSERRRPVPTTVQAGGLARPPPVSLRLAQLQILRL